MLTGALDWWHKAGLMCLQYIHVVIYTNIVEPRPSHVPLNVVRESLSQMIVKTPLRANGREKT